MDLIQLLNKNVDVTYRVEDMGVYLCSSDIHMNFKCYNGYGHDLPKVLSQLFLELNKLICNKWLALPRS